MAFEGLFWAIILNGFANDSSWIKVDLGSQLWGDKIHIFIHYFDLRVNENWLSKYMYLWNWEKKLGRILEKLLSIYIERVCKCGLICVCVFYYMNSQSLHFNFLYDIEINDKIFSSCGFKKKCLH